MIFWWKNSAAAPHIFVHLYLAEKSITKIIITDHSHDEFELFVLIFVIISSLVIQDGNIDTAKDDFQIGSGLTGQNFFHLENMKHYNHDVIQVGKFGDHE